MADDPELAERVRRALDAVPDVVERRMFGGLAFLVGGTLRIAVGTHADHVAMVRTGGAHDAVLDRAGVGPARMRGKPMVGWVFLERQAIDSDEQIRFWVATAIRAV